MQDAIQFEKNLEYQNNLFSNKSGYGKKYQQNQNVYNYYRDLYHKRADKDKELERKFVLEPKEKEEEAEAIRQQKKAVDKERKNLEMKDTLSQQLQLLKQRRQEEGKTNP